MAFRADEKETEGKERVQRQFIDSWVPAENREASRNGLDRLIDEFGPVVESYPMWHPLILTEDSHLANYPITTPGTSSGYKGLDHTFYLRDAFVTCPYSKGKETLESVAKRKLPAAVEHLVSITAEPLDFPLYTPMATPVLVKLEWSSRLRPLPEGIPTHIAVPLFLEAMLPRWRREDSAAETWQTMRGYFLGAPCGSRSSLFVSQETGQALKNVWNTLIQTGMFGPIMATGT